MKNPWNLTPSEVKAMDALCAMGSEKEAAHTLGKAATTISSQVVLAQRKMGARTRLLALLAWDRHKRTPRP